MMGKRYGRLTLEQLLQLRVGIDTFSALRKDLTKAIRANPVPLGELFPNPAYWGDLYDTDFLELISLLIVVSSGLQEAVQEYLAKYLGSE